MAIIDDRGRLFGRLNIIDALIGLLVLGLIPLAYGAYLLFRQPEPALAGVEPARVTLAATSRVIVTGSNLRPYLRVSFNDTQGTTFGFISPERAEVRLPADLPTGVYDVVLYDAARVVDRLPQALTVEGAPKSGEATALVSGTFVGLDADTARQLSAGTALTAAGDSRVTVRAVEPARADARNIRVGNALVELPMQTGQRLDALLHVTCTVVVQRCQVAGVDLEPDFVLPLVMPDGRVARFVVSEAVPESGGVPAEVLVRFVVPAEMGGRIAAGDRDNMMALLGDRGARIRAIVGTRGAVAERQLSLTLTLPNSGSTSVTVPENTAVIDAVVAVAAEDATSGLRYRGRPLKAGELFVLETADYLARGWVLRVTPQGSDATP